MTLLAASLAITGREDIQSLVALGEAVESAYHGAKHVCAGVGGVLPTTHVRYLQMKMAA